MTSRAPIPSTIPSTLDIGGIMALIPHRYPMLMIDRVIDIVPGESCTGIKNVTGQRTVLSGPFSRISDHARRSDYRGDGANFGDSGGRFADGVSCDTHIVYFMTIESARFRKPVVPGDTLHVKVKKERTARQCVEIPGRGLCRWQACAEAIYTAMLVPRDEASRTALSSQ